MKILTREQQDKILTHLTASMCAIHLLRAHVEHLEYYTAKTLDIAFLVGGAKAVNRVSDSCFKFSGNRKEEQGE